MELLHVSTVREQRGKFIILRAAFWAMCWCVDIAGISVSARGREERRERERASPTVQSVVKCSASKPNRSWKQKPFPKSHSRTPPPFWLSHSYLFIFSLLQCWDDSLSLISAFVQSSPFYSSRICCKCQTQQIATYKAHKGPNGDWIEARHDRAQREADLVERETKCLYVWRGNEKKGRRQVRGKEEKARRVIHCVLVLKTMSDTMYDI